MDATQRYLKTMDYVEYFEPLELAREGGNVDDALLKAQQALLEAGKLKDPILAMNAYAHQLLIFKDQFTHTSEDFYLHLMHGLAIAGLTLAEDLHVTGQPLAVIYLRLGDYYFQYKQYGKAVESMEKALQMIEQARENKPGEYSEYLSHLGKARVFEGDVGAGLKNLQEAVGLTKAPTELREFHHKVVHSGNMLRLLFAYYQSGDKEKAIELLRDVYPLAIELKDKYDMRIRLEQVEKLAQAWGAAVVS